MHLVGLHCMIVCICLSEEFLMLSLHLLYFLFSSFLNAPVRKKKTRYIRAYALYENWFPATTFAPYLPRTPTTTIRGPKVIPVHVMPLCTVIFLSVFRGDWAVSNSFVRIASFLAKLDTVARTLCTIPQCAVSDPLTQWLCLHHQQEHYKRVSALSSNLLCGLVVMQSVFV